MSKITLKDFINENDKLLTTLGIFSALTIFFAEQSGGLLSAFLSVGSLTCTVLVWLELWSNFPAGSVSRKLLIFENVLTGLAFILIFYWILKLYEFSILAIWYLIFLIFLSIFSLLFKKFNLFNRFFKAQPGSKKFLRYIIGGIVIVVTLWISQKLSILVLPSVNKFLTEAKSSFSEVKDLDSYLIKEYKDINHESTEEPQI